MATGQPNSLPKAMISSPVGDELGGAGHADTPALGGDAARPCRP
jgi:hypothetical protein